MIRSFSKSLGLSLILLLNITTVFAQFTGTINVGTAQTYTTLTATDGLFNAINNGTVTGDITIQITSDITEPGSIALNKWMESGTGNYQIRIVPDGATERIISGSGANMINLSGVRNVVIDGSFSGTGKFLRFTCANKSANTLAFLNDCKSDTIRNCYVESCDTATNKSAILIGTTGITGGTGNDSIAILNNIIKDNATGYPKNLVRSVGTTTASNDNCIISGNEFINWSNEAMGLAAGTGDNWKILNNAFYQSPTANILTSFYAIRAIAGNGHIISGNSIGGQALDRSGAAMKTASSSMTLYSITGILVSNCGSLSNPILINQNKISNIAGEFSICGIKADTSNVIIDSNVVDNLTIPSATYLAILSLTGINMTRSNATVTNNIIAKIKNTSGGGFGPPTISGIKGNGGQYLIDYNIIDSVLSAYAAQNPNYANTPMPAGILITLSGAVTTNKISNNYISNIINTSYFPAMGITYSSTNTATTNIFNNRIYNIGGLYNSNMYPGTNSNFLVGIQEGGSGSDTIYNNTITIGALAYYTTSIYGIQNTGGGAHVYYNNTVNITGNGQPMSPGPYIGTTAAFYRTGGNTLLRNNILINKRITATGFPTPYVPKNYAIGNASSSGTLNNLKSDYNLLFAADSISAIWGTSPKSFLGWKTASNGDTNSVNAPVTFVSTNDLHIDGTNANAWNVYGRGIAIPTISTDIDGNSRSTVIGTPVTIGADEIPMPTSTPANMVMTPATPTAGTPTVFTSAGKKIAEITWTGGVVPNTITGKYYPGVQAPNTTTSPNINSYFELTPDVTTGIPYTIKAYYTDAEAAGIADDNLWGMKSHTAGVWTGTTLANANGKDANGKYLQSMALNDFSTFSMTGNSTPLSIDLKTITAKNAGNKNRIDWSTAKETKADYFELENSTDARNFKKMANINAKGQASAYTYWDEKAVLGMNYYRLKITTEDGSFIYSKTVCAEVKSLSGFVINAYPNPVQNKVALKIEGNIQANAVITLADISGKVLQTLNVTNHEIEMDMGNLAAGIYFIKYTDDQQTQNIKITKQ